MAATQKRNFFDPGFLFTPSDTFLLVRTVLPQYKTSQTDRQTTDRQTIQCTNGSTDSTVGQEGAKFGVHPLRYKVGVQPGGFELGFATSHF